MVQIQKEKEQLIATVQIQKEKEQLIAAWKRLNVAGRIRERRMHVSHLLRDDPGGRPSRAFYFRKVHDDFGWKAGGNLDNGGLCCGALYRTAAFISLEQDRRNGKLHGPQTVHGEHTVPVCTLGEKWQRWLTIKPDIRNRPPEDQSVHVYAWALSHSVLTAVRTGCVSDQKTDIASGWHSSTKSYSKDVAFSQHYGRPFMRYDKSSEIKSQIYNVYSGDIVSIDKYSFEDNLNNVLSLLKGASVKDDFVLIDKLEAEARGIFSNFDLLADPA